MKQEKEKIKAGRENGERRTGDYSECLSQSARRLQ